MKYLLDTNILLRLIEPNHEQHSATVDALLKLKNQNCSFFILIQNVSEFWNVCTRPIENNGLGLSIARTNAHVKRFEMLFVVLFETEDVYLNWRDIVVKHTVSGVKVHDAKIVAAMDAHGIDRLLTFNTTDFKRYEHIETIAPNEI